MEKIFKRARHISVNLARRLLLPFFPWSRVRVVYIVSTGRTGTEFLADFFAKHFNQRVIARHEPSPDLLDLSVRSAEEGWNLDRCIKTYRLARLPLFIKAFFSGKIILESNNNASFLIPVLRAALPKLRVVFITRAPGSYMLSAINKKHTKVQYGIFSENDPRRRVTPSVLGMGDLYEEWSRWDQAEKIAWHYKTCNETIVRDIKGVEMIQLKFEDIFECDNKVVGINKLIDFVGCPKGLVTNDEIVEAFGRKINPTRSQLVRDIGSLGKSTTELINTLTGPVGVILGYPPGKS